MPAERGAEDADAVGADPVLDQGRPLALGDREERRRDHQDDEHQRQDVGDGGAEERRQAEPGEAEREPARGQVEQDDSPTSPTRSAASTAIIPTRRFTVRLPLRRPRHARR